MYKFKTTSRGGSQLVDYNGYLYYKKANVYICTEYKKEKSHCPAVAKVINDKEIEIRGVHNHSSIKNKAKIIRDEVMEILWFTQHK